MKIKVIEPGFYSSVQDQGRLGFRHLGVPVSGAMDQAAFIHANTLLPFQDDFTVIELTFRGPKLFLSQPVAFVLTGAPIVAQLNEQTLKMNTVYNAPKNSILNLGIIRLGMRSYLRFFGKCDFPKRLNSRSFFLPITQKARLEKGDVFHLREAGCLNAFNAQLRVGVEYLHQTKLDVMPGPDWKLLSPTQQVQLFEQPVQVKAQNRMGYRLTCAIKIEQHNLLSQVVFPGIVQLTPGNELLVATADAQVTGGYAQILQLKPQSLNTLVQKPEGSTLTFQNTPL